MAQQTTTSQHGNPSQSVDANGHPLQGANQEPSLISPPNNPLLRRVADTDLRTRLAQLIATQVNAEPRSTYMQAFADTRAPLRVQPADAWTPPYGYSPQQSRDTGDVQAILQHPLFSPTYGQVDSPMDPPIATEIVSEAIGIPLIRQ